MQNESCSFYERYENTPGERARSLYFYPQWAGRFVCLPDFFIDRLGENKSILLLQTTAGQGTLLYRGKEHLLEAGSLVLINCREPHRYFPISTDAWDFTFLHFYGQHAEAWYDHVTAINGGCLFSFGEKTKKHLDKIIDACRTPTQMHEVVTSKIIHELLHDVILLTDRAQQGLIARVCDYITAQHKNPLSTEDISRHFGFSRTYLSTTFKNATGTSLHDYLLTQRLNAAKNLLQNSNLSVSQIAEESGFGDVGTFIRTFRAKDGITPLQYKKRFDLPTPIPWK